MRTFFTRTVTFSLKTTATLNVLTMFDAVILPTVVAVIAPVTMALREAEAEVHVGADSVTERVAERGTETACGVSIVMTAFDMISLFDCVLNM